MRLNWERSSSKNNIEMGKKGKIRKHYTFKIFQHLKLSISFLEKILCFLERGIKDAPLS